MSAVHWLNKAHEELATLATGSLEEPDDAWRAASLLARVLGAPGESRVPPLQLVGRLPELLEIAGPPDIDELLDELADGLSSNMHPWGGLMDSLLDVDDALGVLRLQSQDGLAQEFASRTCALLSLYPTRLLSFGQFASMRLDSLRPDSIAATMWRVVERSPAEVLADALPARASAPTAVLPSRRSTVPARTVSPFPSRWSAQIPDRLLLQAAASGETGQLVELEVHGVSAKAWIYESDGQMRLEIRGMPAAKYAVALEVCHAPGEDPVVLPLMLEIAGTTGYVDLGPWTGPENQIHRAVAAMASPRDAVRISLVVTRD